MGNSTQWSNSIIKSGGNFSKLKMKCKRNKKNTSIQKLSILIRTYFMITWLSDLLTYQKDLSMQTLEKSIFLLNKLKMRTKCSTRFSNSTEDMLSSQLTPRIKLESQSSYRNFQIKSKHSKIKSKSKRGFLMLLIKQLK